jgi:hypothetical protein
METNQCLLVLEISSISAGYQALKILTDLEDVQVIEASPAGARHFFILAGGARKVLDQAVRSIQARFPISSDLHGPNATSPISDLELLESADQQLLDSLYTLSNEKLGGALVVVECETLSGLFTVAQSLIAIEKLRPLEIKIHRSGGGGGYGFFTGVSDACSAGSERIRNLLAKKERLGRVEFIDRPSEKFRRYFNLSGEV